MSVENLGLSQASNEFVAISMQYAVEAAKRPPDVEKLEALQDRVDALSDDVKSIKNAGGSQSAQSDTGSGKGNGSESSSTNYGPAGREANAPAGGSAQVVLVA